MLRSIKQYIEECSYQNLVGITLQLPLIDSIIQVNKQLVEEQRFITEKRDV